MCACFEDAKVLEGEKGGGGKLCFDLLANFLDPILHSKFNLKRPRITQIALV